MRTRRTYWEGDYGTDAAYKRQNDAGGAFLRPNLPDDYHAEVNRLLTGWHRATGAPPAVHAATIYRGGVTTSNPRRSSSSGRCRRSDRLSVVAELALTDCDDSGGQLPKRHYSGLSGIRKGDTT